MSPEGTIFCSKCGMQLPASAQFCNRCGAAVASAASPAMTASPSALPASPARPAAPMAAAAAAVAPAPVAPMVAATPHYAGFWLRLVAYILDTIILEAIVIPVAFVTGGIIGVISAAGGADRVAVQLAGGFVGFFIGLFASWLYFALLESSAKQSTWGKRALGLYVCDLGGGRISFARACGRYFGKFLSSLILGIGFIMAGFTEKKQALHDMIAGTLVLRRS